MHTKPVKLQARAAGGDAGLSPELSEEEEEDLEEDENDCEVDQDNNPSLPYSEVPSTVSPIRTLRFSERPPIKPEAIERRPSERLRQVDLMQNFRVGKLLGKGSFGTVYEVTCKKTRKKYALKTILVREAGDDDIEAEIASFSEFDHPYILKLHAFVREDACYHLIMDICLGGDLFDYLMTTVNACKEVIPEYDSGLATKVAARFTGMMLSGLMFLHHHGFIHRDIKPENYLLATHSDKAPLKLADFGFARCISKTAKMTQRVGSHYYAAPEVVAGSYGHVADVWSLGITCFAICTNRLPFSTASNHEYAAKAAKGRFAECTRSWEPHLPELRALVYSMLVVNPDKRPTAKQLLAENAWLSQHYRTKKGFFGCGGRLPF